jgi:hypothetical protein
MLSDGDGPVPAKRSHALRTVEFISAAAGNDSKSEMMKRRSVALLEKSG